MNEEAEKQRLPRSHGFQHQRMARLGRPHLPVAYPRSDLASLCHPSSQRFWIPGRLTPISLSLTAFARTARHRFCLAVKYSLLSTSPSRHRGSTMPARTLQTWVARHILVRLRLEIVCTSYLLFLMVVTTKHSLEEASQARCQSPAKMQGSALDNSPHRR